VKINLTSPSPDGLKTMSAMKFSYRSGAGLKGVSKQCGTSDEPEIIPLEQAREALGEAGWSDVKFVAFCHDSVFLALTDDAVISMRLKEEDYDELFEILTEKDRERQALAKIKLIEGDSTSLAA
jgi:hypothetical protein